MKKGVTAEWVKGPFAALEKLSAIQQMPHYQKTLWWYIMEASKPEITVIFFNT